MQNPRLPKDPLAPDPANDRLLANLAAHEMEHSWARDRHRDDSDGSASP